VDLFCLYNRARGTNLVSPEDLNIACQNINSNSSKYMIKEYTSSGIKAMQLRSFNEEAHYKKIEDILKE